MNVVVTGIRGTLSNIVAKTLEVDNNVIQISIRNDLNENIIPENTDCVVHIAGVTPANVKSVGDYELVNSVKTQQLFEIAKKKKTRHFIYISSMSVYEGHFYKKTHPGIGLTTPCMPISEYACSKYQAEENIQKLCTGNLKCTIIRVPSLYDNNKTEYFQGYIDLIQRLPFVPHIPGNCKRSVLHTRNLCALIREIIETPDSFGEIILPQDDIVVDINDILEKIKNDKRIKKPKSYIGGFLLYVLTKCTKKYRNLFAPIYYQPKESVLMIGESMYSIEL